MRRAFRSLPAIAATAVAACAAPDADLPSLTPREAERIDPRLPVERPANDRPADAVLSARLAALVASARSGESGFEAAIATARRAAEGAGARETESWIAAQEALSAAVAARAPATLALGEIDTLRAELLIAQGGIAPSDLAAIDGAASIVADISRRQAEAVAAVQARLGG